MITLEIFMKSFIDTAQSKGKRIVVLRNYQGLPRHIYSKDIDMLITQTDLCEWRDLLSRICYDLGLEYRQGPESYVGGSHYIAGIPNRNRALQIDLISRLNWYGIRYLKVEEVLERAIPYNAGLWIPHPVHECIITFCQNYLHCRNIKDKYNSSLATQIKTSPEEIKEYLVDIFGEFLAQRIVLALSQQDPAEILRLESIIKYHAYAFAKAFVHRPIGVLHDATISGLMRFKVYLNNRVSKLQGQGGNERFTNNVIYKAE